MPTLKQLIFTFSVPVIISLVVTLLMVLALYYQAQSIKNQGCDYYNRASIRDVPAECLKTFLSK